MPGNSAPLETEWSLLRAACAEAPPARKTARIRELLDFQIRWDSLLSLAEHHGVQPILAGSLMNFEHQIPPQALISLKQSYKVNLHKALLLSGEFVRVADSLSQAGIDFIPYKGLALAETVYGDIALRQAGDIDLLIHAADLKRIKEAMGKIGYKPHLTFSEDEEAAYIKSGYECAFDGAAGRNLLEVQWAIEPHFYAVDVEHEGLFRRAQTVRVMGFDTKSLSPEDLFVVLGLHAAKHAWGRLIWLCDLERISKLPLNWNRIAEQAQQLGIARILHVTLLLAEKLLDSPYPALAAENLPEDSAAETLADEIETHISNGKIYDVESHAYFRLMLRLRERRIDRIRFVSRFVFTPGPGEWAVMRLPKPLFPLYRVLRITRLAGRLVSGLV
jgi:Uncharacterised nucleotidyltransferase